MKLRRRPNLPRAQCNKYLYLTDRHNRQFKKLSIIRHIGSFFGVRSYSPKRQRFAQSPMFSPTAPSIICKSCLDNSQPLRAILASAACAAIRSPSGGAPQRKKLSFGFHGGAARVTVTNVSGFVPAICDRTSAETRLALDASRWTTRSDWPVLATVSAVSARRVRQLGKPSCAGCHHSAFPG